MRFVEVPNEKYSIVLILLQSNISIRKHKTIHN